MSPELDICTRDPNCQLHRRTSARLPLRAGGTEALWNGTWYPVVGPRYARQIIIPEGAL